VLIRSDTHFDHPKCNEQLELRHLELAKERDALILDMGDLFDAMQGRDDPRRSNEGMRDKYKQQNYYDLLVNDAAERYTPYAAQWGLFAMGNHETKVMDKVSTDLTSRLVQEMRRAGSSTVSGRFGGWVRFQFRIQKTVNRRVCLKYLHNGGSINAPVTKGIIDTNRQSTWLGNADIVVNGHNHQNYVTAVKREILNNQGIQEFPLMWFIRIPGYLNDFDSGQHGYNVERGAGPLAQGCVWLRFTLNGANGQVDIATSLDLG
jgi:UDP-2,3-diacylglucosamine pyrophosphatase LpxH